MSPIQKAGAAVFVAEEAIVQADRAQIRFLKTRAGRRPRNPARLVPGSPEETGADSPRAFLEMLKGRAARNQEAR